MRYLLFVRHSIGTLISSMLLYSSSNLYIDSDHIESITQKIIQTNAILKEGFAKAAVIHLVLLHE